jgi:hypothetical protein
MLRRFYLVPVLRLFYRAVRIDSAPAIMYCCQCDADEVDRVRQLQTRLVPALAARIRAYLSFCGPLPRIRFLCFGSAGNPARLPCGLYHILREYGEASWWPSLRAVILNMRLIGGSPVRLRVAVAHEFAHALMTTSARRYTYPRAIHEGLAIAIELEFGDPPGPEARRACPWRRALLSNPPTISALLSTEDTFPTDGTFHDACLALFAFLTTLGRAHPGILDNWLADVRRMRLDAHQIYAWFQEKLNLDAGSLEEAFAWFLQCGQVRESTCGDG